MSLALPSHVQFSERCLVSLGKISTFGINTLLIKKQYVYIPNSAYLLPMKVCLAATAFFLAQRRTSEPVIVPDRFLNDFSVLVYMETSVQLQTYRHHIST